MDKAKEKRVRPHWYVVQVNTGSEERMRADITHACAAHDEEAACDADAIGLNELFSPKFASRKKRRGEWVDMERDLLPGYLIADVDNPAALAQALRGMRGFCRLLSDGETYEPLNEAEREWLETQTQPFDRVVPISFGYKEGDALVVTSGPLEGNEAIITKLDRKNCMAHIEFHMGQMTVKTAVGLVVMPSGKVRQVPA